MPIRIPFLDRPKAKPRAMKAVGVLAFVFFLVKGILWLLIPVALVASR